MRNYPHLQFAEDVLKRMNFPVTRQNLQAMLAWQKAEGGHTNNNANWNPLNTSREMGGAGRIDADGVRSYPDYETGVRATVETLNLSYYPGIRAALRTGDSAAAVERAVVASKWAESRYGGSFGTTPWARDYLNDHAATVRRLTADRGGDRRDRSPSPATSPGGADRARPTPRRAQRGDNRIQPWAMPRDGRGGDQPIYVDPASMRGLVRSIDRHLATATGVERRVSAVARTLEPKEVRLVDPAAERELHRTLAGLTRSEGRNLPALVRALARDEAFVLSALADFSRVDESGRGAFLDRVLQGDPRARGGNDRHRGAVVALLAPGGARRPPGTAGGRPSSSDRVRSRTAPDRTSPGDRRPSTALPARQSMGSATPPANLRRHGNGRIPGASLRPVPGGDRLAAPAAEAFTAMAAAARRAGITLPVNDAYRSYSDQVAMRNRKGLWSPANPTGAAQPGRSNHGWGLSVDLEVDSARSAWLRANASRWGFFNDVPGEAWHWTYRPAR